MYSLRTIYDNGTEFNTLLGEAYTVDRYDETKPENAFNNRIAIKEETGKVFIPAEQLADYVGRSKHYATVYSDTSGSIDLFKGANYYIVCSNGQTYANLTKR